MSAKKYQVFVSSTFRDLADERQDAIRNILDLKHIPAGMELFPAADINQFDYIKKVIDECDYYLLIIGGRYGSIDESGVSYTEREYDYAVHSGKVVLAFVHAKPDQIPLAKSETNMKAAEMLDAFRKRVMTGRLVRHWENRQQLEALTLKALVLAFGDMPATGWIRGDAAASEDLLAKINALHSENASLREQLAKLTTNDLGYTPRDLAPLDDTFRIKYRARLEDRSGSTYSDQSLTARWIEIFRVTGSFLSTPTSDAVFLNVVQQLAKDRGKPARISGIDQTTKAIIKAQLTAHGLIKSEVAANQNGTLTEFLSLTPKGKVLLVETLTVRTSDPHPLPPAPPPD